MINVIKEEIKGLSSRLEEEDYVNAVNDAARETGWPLPVSGDTKIKWFKERAKRHIFFMLLSESAHKFKFKQYNLQHRFEHYRSIIRTMDREYINAIEEHPEKFANVSASQLFGHKIDAGFKYDNVGRDLTYDSDNVVQVGPKDSD